jgi:hypothetical protein
MKHRDIINDQLVIKKHYLLTFNTKENLSCFVSKIESQIVRIIVQNIKKLLSYVHIHMYTYTYKNIHAHISGMTKNPHERIKVYTYTYVHAYIHAGGHQSVRIYTYVHTQLHTYIQACTCHSGLTKNPYVANIYIHSHIHTYMHMSLWVDKESIRGHQSVRIARRQPEILRTGLIKPGRLKTRVVRHPDIVSRSLYLRVCRSLCAHVRGPVYLLCGCMPCIILSQRCLTLVLRVHPLRHIRVNLRLLALAMRICCPLGHVGVRLALMAHRLLVRCHGPFLECVQVLLQEPGAEQHSRAQVCRCCYMECV